MIATYANPEPMLKTESNGGTITRKQLMTLVSWECFIEHPVIGDRFSIIDSVQRLVLLRLTFYLKICKCVEKYLYLYIFIIKI